MDFYIKFLGGDADAHVYVCPLERGCCVVSEAMPATDVILNAAVKFMEANWP